MISLNKITSAGVSVVPMTWGSPRRHFLRGAPELLSINRMALDGSPSMMLRARSSMMISKMGIGSSLVKPFTSKAKFGLKGHRMPHSILSLISVLRARTVKGISSLPIGRTTQIQTVRSSSRSRFLTWTSQKV